MQREPRPIRFDAGGMDLAALMWGPDDGPLALCLHGFPDTAWTWRHLGPALAGAGWHVVAPFLRGYAPSGLAPDGAYGVGALVHDVIDAHRRFARRGRSVLVGHDWGAITAYAVGSYRPELFDRIVTLAVPPVGPLFRALASPAGLPSALGQAASSWYTAFHQIPRLPELVLPRLVPRLWATWSPGYDARADLEHLAPTLAEPERRSAILGYYRAVAPWRRNVAYAAGQRHWTAVPPNPVLYLHGVADGCVRAGPLGAVAASLAPGSRFEPVSGAGHFLHLEQPEDVHRMIADFVGVPA